MKSIKIEVNDILMRESNINDNTYLHYNIRKPSHVLYWSLNSIDRYAYYVCDI